MNVLKLAVAVALVGTVGLVNAKDDKYDEGDIINNNNTAQGGSGGSVVVGDTMNTNTNNLYGGENHNTVTGGNNTNQNSVVGGDNTNNNKVVGKNTNNNNANSTSNAQGGRGGRGGNATTGNNSNTTNVNVQGDNYDMPVASAYAPTVQVGGADQCRITYSGGTQTSALGISFGSSVVDENCERLKLAREVGVTLGDKEVAKQILCQDERVAKAYASVGRACKVVPTTKVEVTNVNTQTAFGSR